MGGACDACRGSPERGPLSDPSAKSVKDRKSQRSIRNIDQKQEQNVEQNKKREEIEQMHDTAKL